MSGKIKRMLRSRRRSTGSDTGAPKKETPTINHVRAVAVRQILDYGYGILLRRVDDVIGPEFPRHGTCFRADIDSDDASRSADTDDLHAFESHAALPKDRDGITHPHACGFHRRNAVAEGLKAGGFTVRDSIVDVCQRNFRENCKFRETAGQMKADNWSLAAEMRPPITAQRALATRKFRAGGNTVAAPKATDAFTGLQDASAVFMSEQLHRRLSFKALFDSFKRECGNSERKLSFGNAGLHAENLGEDVTRPDSWYGNIVQAHVAESVESPGLHRCLVYVFAGPPRITIGIGRLSNRIVNNSVLIINRCLPYS
jgi:hypothetical protein